MSRDVLHFHVAREPEVLVLAASVLKTTLMASVQLVPPVRSRVTSRVMVVESPWTEGSKPYSALDHVGEAATRRSGNGEGLSCGHCQ